MPTALDDQDLLRRAQNGDSVAFQDLIRPHMPMVRRFALGFCPRPADADDLAQEALLRAYRALRSFRGQSALATWLFAVTRSTCLDFARSRQGRQCHLETTLDDSLLDTQDPQELLVSRKRHAEQLWACIRCLDAKFRIPLILYDIEGMPYEHIAKIEGVPIGTVRSRLARARNQLRGLLVDKQTEQDEAISGTSASRVASNATRRPA